MKKTLLGIILFFSFAMLIGAAAFSGFTLIEVWLPWCAIAFLALFSGFPLWRCWKCITSSDKPIWNYLLNTLVAAAVLGSAFFIPNFIFSDRDSNHSVKATVMEKFSREQSKRRTVGRRIIYTGEKYRTYHIRLRFDNGLEKERPVDLHQYMRIHTGDKIDYNVERGLFGIPVIKP